MQKNILYVEWVSREITVCYVPVLRLHSHISVTRMFSKVTECSRFRSPGSRIVARYPPLVSMLWKADLQRVPQLTSLPVCFSAMTPYKEWPTRHRWTCLRPPCLLPTSPRKTVNHPLFNFLGTPFLKKIHRSCIPTQIFLPCKNVVLFWSCEPIMTACWSVCLPRLIVSCYSHSSYSIRSNAAKQFRRQTYFWPHLLNGARFGPSAHNKYVQNPFSFLFLSFHVLFCSFLFCSFLFLLLFCIYNRQKL